jgi:outer membrane protein assembly factor BamD (BamD/ComL family)
MRLVPVLLLLLFLSPFQRLAAAEPGEVEAYNLAANAFADRFFEVAEKQFAEFRAKFPKSAELSTATLFQARAMASLKKGQAALELLDQTIGQAGPLADQYLLLKGEILAEKGDHAAAQASFRKAFTDFPASTFRLAAAFGLASSYFDAKDYTNTVQTLKGPFREASAGATNILLAARGALLGGEALLQLGQIQEVLTLLNPPFAAGTPAELEWRRNQLLARAQLAGAKPELGFEPLTNALQVAQKAGLPSLEAQTLQLQAEIHKKLNHIDKAIGVYEQITARNNLPPDQKRLGLLKAVELYVDQNRLTNAISRLETYLAQTPGDPATDLLRLRTAELWLQRFYSLNDGRKRGNSPADRPALTNALQQSRAHLNFIVTQLTNSVHIGKAYLDLGWTFWEEGVALNETKRIPESQLAFQTAFDRLTKSDEQALAKLKWADAQLQQKMFQPALTNYTALIADFSDLPGVRANLLDKAHQNRIRAALELGDFKGASAALAEMKTAYPANPRTEQTILLFAQYLVQNDQVAEARKIYSEFLKEFPQSTLAPDALLAEAKTHSLEQNWAAANAKYTAWINAYTNHVARPEAEFERAWVNFQAGNYPASLTLLTNFITAYPTNRLAPAAQNLIADYYWDQQRWPIAEQSYQKVFQNTNWPVSELSYHAKLMAARTAFLREGYADARGYLTNLIAELEQQPSNPLLPEAFFAYGDVLMEQRITASANDLNNFSEAAKVFDLISNRWKTNKLAALALGKKGDCHLQLAMKYPDSYGTATNAYLAVIESKIPDIPISARNQAEVGLALVLEKLSETKSQPERHELLEAALTRLLNVVYSPAAGKASDPLWVKKAALTAARIAEAMGDRQAALALYQRLCTALPSLRTTWEARISALSPKQL